MAAQAHQVIIVGGGITGLTMALMLQRLGVDYILLEAYGSVTPEQGASIALYANGLRILDQLGIFSQIEKVGVPAGISVHRDHTNGGKRMMVRDAGVVLSARHGYGTWIMSRHDLLTTMHANITDKDRLLVNKRVNKIDNLDDCARVYTTDGSVYEGQLIIGADGIRSFVREEMWRHAEEEEQRNPSKSSATPSPYAADKAAIIPCEHACLFGTANPKPGISPGDVVVSCGDRIAMGLNGAPNGDIFFFWFWSLPPPQNSCPITAIPRFTDDDIKRELENCKGVLVTDEGLTMGEILGDLKHIGVTALPHFVVKKWSRARLVVLGDAAHKFNPLIGQGGNSCIESSASLVNALQEHVLGGTSVTEKSVTFPLESLQKALAAFEQERVSRVEEMVERSQGAMRTMAWESWKPKVLSRYIIPYVPIGKLVDFYSWFMTPSVRLYGDKFPAPPTIEHSILYEDEKSGGGGIGKKLGSVAAPAPAAAVAA